MYEPTREQESKIAALALEHGSVHVEVDEAWDTVKATADGRTWLIDANGIVKKAPPGHATVNIPLMTLRKMLGDAPVDRAIADLDEDENEPFREYALGRSLREQVLAALGTPVA